MEGDSPMDLLNKVERLDPRKAGNLIEKELKSREFTDRYAAMGVWDVVMSSGVSPYVTVFEYLGPDVAMAARKGIPQGDEWEDDTDVLKWLRYYKSGKPSGKLRRNKFIPKALKGAVWYVLQADADFGGYGVELSVELLNTYTDERKDIEESFEAPGEGETGNIINVTNYGGKGSGQQSILIEAEDEEGDEYDRQIDINPETGEFTDLGMWGGPN
jgi:hypothetical protein